MQVKPDLINYRHHIVVFTVPLLIYMFSMPLTIALEDDGLFVMSSFFNGVSHPPGYPLHSFIGYIFSMIPIGSIAARVHAVSAFFGALTCVLIWLFVHDLFRNKAVAYLGAMSYAVSETFWSQSIIAEVYTLNTFFFFSILYLSYKIHKLEISGKNGIDIQRHVFFTAFLFGLSLSNHWPLMVLSAPCFLLLVLRSMQRQPLLYVKSIFFIFVGLLPYLWMVINSQADPEISYMGPISSWNEFFYFISRAHYSAIDSSAGVGITEKLLYLGFFISKLSTQFTYLGFLFLITGFIVQFKYLERVVCLALSIGFACTSFLLVLLLGFEYSKLFQSVMGVYFLVAYGIASIWLAIGVYFINELLINKGANLGGKFIHALLVIMLPVLLMMSFNKNYRHNYDWAEIYANKVLSTVPENGIFIVNDDISVGAIGYSHFVLGNRPDIKLLADRSRVFKERIFDPNINDQEEIATLLRDYVYSAGESVYTTAYNPELFNHLGWLTSSYNPDSGEESVVIHVSAMDRDYLLNIYNMDTRYDVWTEYHRMQLMISSVPYIVERIVRGDNDRLYYAVLSELFNDLDGMLMFSGYIKQRGLLTRFGGIESMLDKMDLLYDNARDISSRSRYLYFRGLLDYEDENISNAIDYYKRSVTIWPDVENKSFVKLGEIFKKEDRADDYNDFIKQFSYKVNKKYAML